MPASRGNNAVCPIDDESTSSVPEKAEIPAELGRSSFVYNGQVIQLNNITRPCKTEAPCKKISWRIKACSLIRQLMFCASGDCGLTFKDESLESFYKIYSNKQKVLNFMSVLIFNLCFAFILIILNSYNYEDGKIPSLVVIVTSILITVSIFIAYKKNFIGGATIVVLSYLLWLLILLQLLMTLLDSGDSQRDLSHSHTGDTTVWLLLLSYFAYVVLPARRKFCVIFSVIVNIIHISIILVRCHLNEKCETQFVLETQVAGNAVLYLIINILGYMTAYLSEKNQRRSFLEIKESIVANAFIEEQLLEQEQLLISVLPRHIASNMMADIVSENKEERFRKMYMTRHENVSILFADIVGFTTLSSIKSASEVCSLLNELFTTFDDLAEKYHQLRIKILGDCYYCISGAPEPRADHAVLCVHMGLEICEAIKVVRQRLEYCDVDMRVGIHSGKVLGGVIGQRQWQYDVMSNEVNVANQMETYGVPGRVHISDTVTKYLDGQFILEEQPTPEALLIHGMKTYLVANAIKKYPLGTLDEVLRTSENEWVEEIDDVSSIRAEESVIRTASSADNNITTQLYLEMMKKDKTNSVTLGKSNTVALWFADNNLELDYKRKEILRCGVNMLAMDLVLIVNLGINAALYSVNGSIYPLIPYLIGTALTIPLRVLSLGSHLAEKIKCTQTCLSCLRSIDQYRHIITVITTSIAYAAHLTSFYIYHHTEEPSPNVTASDGLALIPTDNNSEAVLLNDRSASDTTSAIQHNYTKPDFFIVGIALTLIATHLLNHVGYIIRALFMMLMAIASSLIIMFRHQAIFFSQSELGVLEKEDYNNHIRAIAALCGSAFILSCLSYQRDKSSRKLFLSRIESDAQREKIGSLRGVNEKLVHNILPPYIASHFLRRRNNRDLYSESYEDVAVMFIAIPQFQSFYSEEHYNNDGLECIRFLNEIISDFDEVLDNVRFNGITKIKTIGSTYMVAVGMDEKKRRSTEKMSMNIVNETLKYCDIDTVDSFSLDIDSGYSSSKEMNVRQKMLIKLVEFALALRDQMDSINEQSFNTFMLQIGLNHGPVIGGVIGARKPHYDIWGNTVNVASRMQTTGKPGKIQLTSESKEQLENVCPYQFETRGKVMVKGKGQLDTFLIDCSPKTENSYLWT